MDIVNLQRKIKLNSSVLRTFVEIVQNSAPEVLGKTFTLAVINDDRMKQLNEMFRGKDSTTDVLSFPHEPDEFLSEPGAIATGLLDDEFGPHHLGDIVISAEQAQKQAAENGLDLNTEIKQLILHGLLHLCGYNHETDNGEMNARELELREELGI